MTVPRTRTFTPADQESFAAFSGDRNPMHMDADAARRTQAGGRAVHGVHAALWALEALAADGAPLDRLASAKVEFASFLTLGTPVSLRLRASGPDRRRAEVVQDGRPAVVLDLAWGERPPRSQAPEAGPAAPPPRDPADPDFAALARASGALLPPDGAATLAARLFPRVSEALGADTVAAIGLLSTLVGMAAPGLHSIFSGLAVTFETDPAPDVSLRYAVQRADERFRLVATNVAGPGFSGTINAFVRFPPVEPPPIADLANRVAPDAFAGRTALVIGGSRGLGATTAKLIAAGGGSVTITYRSGTAEAERIAADIAAHRGPDQCRIVRYDALGDPAEQLAGVGPFSHLYYFATGHIANRRALTFDRAAFDAFVEIYIAAFEHLVDFLLAQVPDGRLTAFYPSSVFVAERPRHMTEYAMAKSAGEILCQELARAHRGLTVSAPRLPRVMTDQTATVPPVPAADPVEAMLPLLLAENG